MSEGGRGRWATRWNAAILVASVAIVAAASAAGLLYIDRAGEALIGRQEKQAVDSELEFLSEVQIDEGDAGLARSVSRRARIESQGRLYALRDASGAVVAGNLRAFPEGVAADGRWTSVAVGDLDAHVAATTLENGYVALVGRDNSAQNEFRRELLAAAAIAVAVVAAICLLLGAAVTNAILVRVRALSAAAMRVSAGDFSARAAGADDAGPFGDIARAQNAMLDRIEELITGLRTVTDSLAHDLRTPLARLRQRIERGLVADDPGARQEALEEALVETDRTISAFSALVDVARASGGLSRDAMQALDVAEIARDAVELFEPLAEERGMRLAVAFSPAPARANKALLMQAVSNLLHNAIKYGPERSEIEVRAGAAGSEVEVVVADRGPGIPQDSLSDAVKRFHRLPTDETRTDGLGLGLAIADACARLHGGALLLERNEPGLRARLVIPGTSAAKA